MQDEKLKQLIEKLCRDEPKNRNSYAFLLLNTWRELGFKVIIDVDEVFDMPSPESISRAFRSLKKEYPELAGSDMVEENRRKNEQEYKNHYSRKMKEDYPFTSKYIND